MPGTCPAASGFMVRDHARPMRSIHSDSATSAQRRVAVARTRLKRIALAGLFVAGSLAGLGFAAESAQAQFVNPVPAPPPPVFNPSTPSTVPQAPEAPVAPSLPSAAPGSGSVLPLDVGPPSIETQPPEQATIPTPAPSNAATAQSRRSVSHYARRPVRENYRVAGVTRPRSSYRLPLNYHGPSCVWRPDWTGYWSPVCF